MKHIPISVFPKHALTLLLPIYLIFLSLTVTSQITHQVIPFTATEGLNGTYLQDIAQDKQGFIWMNMEKFITRYDGYSFKNYYHKTGDSLMMLGPQLIGNMGTDEKGNVWINNTNTVFHNGFLLKYDPGSDGFTCYRPKLKNEFREKLSIHQDEENSTIWIGSSAGDGLYEYNVKKGQTFEYINPNQDSIVRLAMNTIFSIDVKGPHLYLFTAKGLWKFNRETHRYSRPDINPQDSSFLFNRRLSRLPNSNWVQTESNELIKLDSAYNVREKLFLPEGLKGTLYRIAADQNDQIWYLTSIGCYLYDSPKKQLRFIAETPAEMYDLFIDRNGNAWIGGYGGVQKISPYDFPITINRIKNKTAVSFINSIEVLNNSKDQEHIIVLGNEEIWYGPSSLTPVEFNPVDLTVISKGKRFFFGGGYYNTYEGKDYIWLIDQGRGVIGLRFDKQTGLPLTNDPLFIFHEPANPNTIGSVLTWTLFEDSQNNLWVGSYQGLSKVNLKQRYGTPGSVVRYNHSPSDSLSISSDIIRSILPAEDDGLWISTGTGVDHFQNGKFRHVLHMGSFVDYLMQGSDSNIYALTYQGIYRAEKSKGFKSFSQYLDINANDMVEDNQGRFWLLTKQGLACYDPAKNLLVNFGDQPYLNGFKDYVLVLDRGASGIIALASDSVVVTFDPASFQISKEVAKPVLTSLEVNNRKPIVGSRQAGKEDFVIPVDITQLDKLTMDYRHNNFSVEFSALDMRVPNRIRYRYKLEGYNAEWIETDWKNRRANYTNLDAGDYSFRVQATNSHGIWGDQDTVLQVEILPPPWKTWWAYTLYILFFAITLFSFIRWRIASLRKDKEALEYEVAHRTQQLKVAKEDVEQSLSELKTTQQELIQREKMASLGELTAGIAHEIQNPLNFVNNFTEVNRELIVELREEIKKGNLPEVSAIVDDIDSNEEKILIHGQRADAIVKSMLQHSRAGSGKKEPTDINALADEYLRLAYHGMRAKDKSFNVTLHTDFDASLQKINIIPQDIGRVLLNLVNNAFYAVHEKKQSAPDDYEPAVSVSTEKKDNIIIIAVKDNGNGIPEKIKNKIFQPFFTTKPTGKGTGLGLSLSYDIVKAHGGEIRVESNEGGGTEFMIKLPIV